MTIQFNTDHNIHGTEKLQAAMTEIISDGLKRFSSHITRIEVHLTDENGKKEGINDKRCVLEARMEGRSPIAVTAHANSYNQAVDAATEKLKSSLDTITGRLHEHRK